MVANPANRVVAKVPAHVVANVADEAQDDEDDGVVVELSAPRNAARIEVSPRQRKNKTVYIIRWRWQLKNSDGSPCRSASGGYKRGSRYVKTISNRKDAKRIKANA